MGMSACFSFLLGVELLTKRSRTMIIITERDIFDYSNGEPPEGILTVLRALEVCSQSVREAGVLTPCADHGRIRRSRAHQPLEHRANDLDGYA